MNKFVPVILIFLLAIFVSIMVGPAQLTSEIIQLRLSRVILGIFAGGILAFCGGVLQGLFGNPLVEPYTLGSASGAALGGSIGILLFGTISPLFAFFGSLGVGFFVFTVARIEGGLLRDRLILAGVVMSFLCSSLVFGLNMPQRILSMVDFPAPLGPIIPRNSPCSNEKETFFITSFVL